MGEVCGLLANNICVTKMWGHSWTSGRQSPADRRSMSKTPCAKALWLVAAASWDSLGAFFAIYTVERCCTHVPTFCRTGIKRDHVGVIDIALNVSLLSFWIQRSYDGQPLSVNAVVNYWVKNSTVSPVLTVSCWNDALLVRGDEQRAASSRHQS